MVIERPRESSSPVAYGRARMRERTRRSCPPGRLSELVTIRFRRYCSLNGTRVSSAHEVGTWAVNTVGARALRGFIPLFNNSVCGFPPARSREARRSARPSSRSLQHDAP